MDTAQDSCPLIGQRENPSGKSLELCRWRHGCYVAAAGMKSTLTLVLSSYILLSACNAQALTVEELHTMAGLTPETFASHFAGFQFVFRADVQTPEAFLASQAGDCDDFSTLAASELTARGYTTRLVAIRMKRDTHVVCYVNEAHGYLDYNLRARGGLVSCAPEISQIADSVVKSFKSASWTSASEFTYGQGVKRLVKTVVPTAKLTASTARISNHN